MSLPYTRREKLAGLFFLTGMVIIFLSAVIVGGGRDWFRSHNTYYALYNDGYGLTPGGKVRLRRIDIGRVTRMELTENNKVKVHLSILAEYGDRITTDTVAAIGSPTFIGSEYVDIQPGSPKTEIIPPGGQIPSMERKSLEDYFRELRLDVMLARVEAIMVNIDSMTHQLQEPTGPFMGTLSDVRKITSAVAEGEGTLGQLLSNDAAFKEIQKILTDIQKITGNFTSVSGNLGESLPPIINKVNRITSQVERATRRAPDTMRGAQRGVDNANQVLESVKRNFFIRGNLPPAPELETQTVPARSRP